MKVPNLFILAMLVFAYIFTGCSIAPLVPDQIYPPQWGEITTLSGQCKGIEGLYQNEGERVGSDNKEKNISLTSMLYIPSKSKNVSLYTKTSWIDPHGDSFMTLKVVTNENNATYYELACSCINENVVCTGLNQGYGFFPIGFTSGGTNVYFSVSKDGSLIAKSEDIGFMLLFIIPIRIAEHSWARFKHVDQ